MGSTCLFGLNSAYDLFGKVQRDRARVEREVTPDALFNFAVTAHSLFDWVKKDPTISAAAKDACVCLAKTNNWLKACRDLANGSKHSGIERYEPFVEHADAVAGYGVGRYGAGAYGQGEWRITISWDGATHDVLELVAHVTEAWAAFFQLRTQYGGEGATKSKGRRNRRGDEIEGAAWNARRELLI